jgi:peptide/nickel transport system permease protein
MALELNPEPNVPPVVTGGTGTQAALLRRALRSPLARNRAAVAGLVILLPLLVMVCVPWLLAGDPNAQDLSVSLQPPAADHLLGADKLGRDVWARIVFGARPTLLGAFVVIVISGIIGIPLGLIAGFYGGRVDFVITRVLDALLAFPALLLAILVVATFGSGLGTVVVALGIIYVPAMARLVRSVTLVHARLAYVDAGRALGFSNRRIMLRHILPNLVAAVVVQSTIDLAYAILDIAALSFLGLGQQPPDPDWGSMLADARSYLLQDPWPAMSAGIAIALAVVSVNLVGDGLRSQLDPRERER